MKKLVILGAGQYGLVAKEVAQAMGVFSKIEFLDDNSEIAVGKLEDIEKMSYDAAFVAIGNPSVRSQWIARIPKLATLIHPKAVVMLSANIGEGSIVEAGAVICSNVQIGNGSIIMANAVVGHDAKVGECCQLKYNSTVPERSIVPSKTKIDCNVVYRNYSEMNQKFIKEETEKNGVEPSFF